MEKVYFSLEIRDDNRLTRAFRVILGLLCTAIGLYWTVYNLISGKAFGAQWITVAFLITTGGFQIYAGFGLAVKFIEISSDYIRLKRNSILPVINISSSEIETIELFPLKVIFFLQSGKRVLLRFGISDPDKVEDVKKRIIEFADSNGLRLDIIKEEI